MDAVTTTTRPPSGVLPIASAAQTREASWALVRRHRGALTRLVALNAFAAIVALVGPRAIGYLVNKVGHGLTNHEVNVVVAIIGASLFVQALLTWYARRLGYVVGEQVFAELREDFVAGVLTLPPSVVERAGTGDLLSRLTNDMEALSRTVQFAIPETLVGLVTVVITFIGVFLTGPLIAIPSLVGVPLLLAGTRWYLKRAPAGYLRERAAYSALSGTLGETVDGARTVEALRLQQRRNDRLSEDFDEAFAAERYTLFLRCLWFPTVDLGIVAPVAATVLWGGFLVLHGRASLGAVTAIGLYSMQLGDPIDKLLSWLDELQIGSTSLARLVGVTTVPPDRHPTGEQPVDEVLRLTDVRFAYREGRDVLHGVSMTITPGERLAIVGPSGAGKSTLARLLAGIDTPRTGQVTVGDVRLVDLDAPTLRAQVALLTQEHHVFLGTLGDNLRLASPGASDDQLWAALEAVDAAEWARATPEGLETLVGSDGYHLSPAQQQQLALARVVLIDPHTLILDEATSLMDPGAARHLERSLSAVLEGRTVVAIAHRLHTAHDADRVAVVAAGVVAEIGSHDELVAADGDYAALWASWHGH